MWIHAHFSQCFRDKEEVCEYLSMTLAREKEMCENL